MPLSEARDRFVGAHAPRVAPDTIKNYRACIDSFITAVGDIQIGNVTHMHADAFFTAIGHLAVSTRNLRRTNLCYFFKWLRDVGYLPPGRDPFINYRKPFEEIPPERFFLAPEDFPRLLDHAGHPRDRAAIALGLYTQLRKGDIRRLRVGDLDLPGRRLSARIQKSKKKDNKPVSPTLAEEMERWLTWYVDRVGPLRNDWFLVPRKTSPKIGYDRALGRTRMVPNSVGVIPNQMGTTSVEYVHDALRAMGIDPPKGVGMHTLRRSGADAIVRALTPVMGQAEALEIARVSLNQKKQETTALYLQRDTEVEKRDELFLSGKLFGKREEDVPSNVIPLRRKAVGG